MTEKKVTTSMITSALHSSLEGIVFLVCDSLEFELDRTLTQDEAKDVFTHIATSVNMIGAAPAAQRLVDSYICNKGRDSEFIAVYTPNKSSIGTGGVWDDWRELDAELNRSPTHKKA